MPASVHKAQTPNRCRRAVPGDNPGYMRTPLYSLPETFNVTDFHPSHLCVRCFEVTVFRKNQSTHNYKPPSKKCQQGSEVRNLCHKQTPVGNPAGVCVLVIWLAYPQHNSTASPQQSPALAWLAALSLQPVLAQLALVQLHILLLTPSYPLCPVREGVALLSNVSHGNNYE